MSNHYIYTYTGRVFDLLEPKPEMICLADIFHSLAITNRFTGHTLRAYSVLEHSILGALAMSNDADAMDFLLHDAAEGFCGDMASPLKALCPEYRVILSRIEHVISQKYSTSHTPQVKQMDLCMLATERRDLLKDGGVQCSWVVLDGMQPLLTRITQRCAYTQSRTRLVAQAFYLASRLGGWKEND